MSKKYQFTSASVPSGQNSFSGGLNSTSGPLNLEDNESPDLQNVDFNEFGSVLSRNGSAVLNSSAIGTDVEVDGLHWYEFNSAGSIVRKLVSVANAKLLKMDDLDGTWDDITGGLTITATNHCDFENFLNEVYITNNEDVPFKWDGTTAAAMTVPTGLTQAKHVTQYNNYLFLGNVKVSGTRHGSRFYWSDLKDTTTFGALNFIEVSKDDGQEITGMKVLSDRLVIFKERSIYNVFFTGDNDIPFILPGGGKTNSSVGCVAPYSIQVLENGLIFLSTDGFYFFDGSNSLKVSDKISSTLDGYNNTRLGQAVSMVQNGKNRYFCSLPNSGQTTNDRVAVLDWNNRAWSIYVGLAPASMATVYVDGFDERIYFGDYDGFVYRMDIGDNDNPSGVETAINAYYYTSWKHYNDIVNQKGIPHVYVYYRIKNAIITFSYSYNLDDNDTYSNTFDTSSSADVYGTGVYGTAVYAGEGGSLKRLDLTSRGRLVRFKFSNNVVDEEFRIDGLGIDAHLESNV